MSQARELSSLPVNSPRRRGTNIYNNNFGFAIEWIYKENRIIITGLHKSGMEKKGDIQNTKATWYKPRKLSVIKLFEDPADVKDRQRSER